MARNGRIKKLQSTQLVVNQLKYTMGCIVTWKTNMTQFSEDTGEHKACSER